MAETTEDNPIVFFDVTLGGTRLCAHRLAPCFTTMTNISNRREAGAGQDGAVQECSAQDG